MELKTISELTALIGALGLLLDKLFPILKPILKKIKRKNDFEELENIKDTFAADWIVLVSTKDIFLKIEFESENNLTSVKKIQFVESTDLIESLDKKEVLHISKTYELQDDFKLKETLLQFSFVEVIIFKRKNQNLALIIAWDQQKGIENSQIKKIIEWK